MADIPVGIPWGVVVGNLGGIISDTSDEGRVPNVEELTGTATLRPVTATEDGTIVPLEWIQFPAHGIYRLRTLVCPIIAGKLYPPDTTVDTVPVEHGVPVIASSQPEGIPTVVQWEVTFNLDGVDTQPHTRLISVPADGVVDLAGQVGEDPLPGVVVVTTTEATTRAVTAAGRAESASESAQLSASSAGESAFLAQGRAEAAQESATSAAGSATSAAGSASSAADALAQMQKGEPGGVAELDAAGLLPETRVPERLTPDALSATIVDSTGRRLDGMRLAADGVPTTMRTAGDGLVARFDYGHAGDNYLRHERAEAGSSGYLSALGLDAGSAGGILVSAKNDGPGIWISSNPSHSGVGLNIDAMSRRGNTPFMLSIFEGASPAVIRASRGAGFYDGVASTSGDAMTFTSATAAFTASDVGKALTQLTSRGEGFIIPVGTTITERVSSTTVRLSQAVTGDATGINFLIGERPPGDAATLLELRNNDGLPRVRFRNKADDTWYGKGVEMVSDLGSNQHVTRRRFDGTRFYRYFSGGSTYNINAILASSSGSVQFIGYDNNATPGSETGGAVAFEFKKGQLAFFGAALTTKPTGVPVTAEGIHAALVTLGLIGA